MLDLEAWKMRMPFLGTGTFMRKTRMELDGKEKGGEVWRVWFLTFGFQESSRYVVREVDWS